MLSPLEREQHAIAFQPMLKRIVASVARGKSYADDVESAAQYGLTIGLYSYEDRHGVSVERWLTAKVYYEINSALRQIWYGDTNGTHRTSKNSAARKNVARPVYAEDMRGFDVADHATEERIDALALQDAIVRATRKIRDEDITMLLQRAKGRTYVELGAEVGLTEAAIRKRVQNARAIIKAELTAEDLV